MNCRRFQHRLYEYLDGTLSRRAQTAAERHLSECAGCREALRAERALAQSLSDKFQRATDSLALPPEVEFRLLAALARERNDPVREQDNLFSWARLVWPVGLTASVSLLLAGVFFFGQGPGSPTARHQARFAGGGVSVQLSFVVPSYTFRHEGGFVTDTLTYQTNVVNEKLQATQARLH